ncbi:hypothetical protein I6E81_06430 [Salinibacterium sp. NG22]|uniref:hypothetical protein n=1 Tax=Salinibacterium sp. NG22 TaxID=2792040 RepID=UPI0018CDECB6|nr:hypothetical protein [Salinibacterium sp. NG22]MBH0109799.1 hypothetical protein [Salinibacterium sp. NG22]
MSVRRSRPAFAAVAAALLILPLAACTAEAEDPIDAIDPLVETQAVCEQVSDAVTLTFNLSTSVDQGRAIEAEYEGAKRVAARMIQRISPSEETKLAPLIAELQAVTPAAAVAAEGEPYDPDSAEWTSAYRAVLDQCEAELGMFGIEGWVGG